MSINLITRRRLVVLPLVALPIAARAHAILEHSEPPAGSTVHAGQTTLRLRYNSRVDRARSRLTLTKPDHSMMVLTIDPDGPADVLTAQADLTPGDYSVHWQVLAVDGHITRGDVPFTVAAP